MHTNRFATNSLLYVRSKPPANSLVVIVKKYTHYAIGKVKDFFGIGKPIDQFKIGAAE